jgi:AbrB family looped-hinge helix DNA binding protein
MSLVRYFELMAEKIRFSKKVDSKGRLVIPKEHRKALGIEGREALVEFEAQMVTFLDEESE